MQNISLTLLALMLLAAPALAQETAKDAKTNDVEIIKVTDGIHVLISPEGGNVTASTGEDGTFIIDDQLEGRSEIITDALKTVSDKNVKFILNTHFHFDHTGGNEFLNTNEDSIIIAHNNVRQRLNSDQFIAFFKKHMPALSKEGLPVVTFAYNMSLHLNNDDIEIYHTPNAHTDGDSIAIFKSQNVIVAGDAIFNGMYPFIDIENGGSIMGTIAAQDEILRFADDKTVIIPGHGPVMNKAELQIYRDSLAKIAENIKTIITNSKTLEETIAAKPTQEFDEKLGNGFIAPDAFTTILYNDLKNSPK